MGRIELGDFVNDSTTGYKGEVTALVTYLHGPTQACVENVAEGEIKAEWINVGRLVLAPRPVDK